MATLSHPRDLTLTLHSIQVGQTLTCYVIGPRQTALPTPSSGSDHVSIEVGLQNDVGSLSDSIATLYDIYSVEREVTAYVQSVRAGSSMLLRFRFMTLIFCAINLNFKLHQSNFSFQVFVDIKQVEVVSLKKGSFARLRASVAYFNQWSYQVSRQLGLVFSTSVEWSILCFIDFFASLSARLNFKCGKMIKETKNALFYARSEN